MRDGGRLEVTCFGPCQAVCNYRALDSPGISIGLGCSPEDANLESPLEFPVALSAQCIFPQLEPETPGMFDKNVDVQVLAQTQGSFSKAGA